MIWGCVACGLALAGGMFWGTCFAQASAIVRRQGSDSLLRVVILLNPTTGLAPVLAEKVWYPALPQVLKTPGADLSL